MSDRVPQPQDKYVVRFPDGMRDQIKAAAEANNRSMNAEIVYRLQQSFDVEPAISVDDFQKLVFGDSSDEDRDNAPSPADVLASQLRHAVSEAVVKTLSDLNDAGMVTMLFDVRQDVNPPLYYKPSKKQVEGMRTHSNKDNNAPSTDD